MAYERIKCPMCSSKFGQESRFLVHMRDEHAVTDTLSLYLELHRGGEHPTCQCSDSCSEKLPWSGWKKGFTSRYVRGHNARVDSVYLDPDRQREFTAKRIEGHASGRYTTWNKGLTSERDERIAAAALKTSNTLNEGYVSGRLTDWRKKDPQRAQAAARRSSETKRSKFASGETVPWNLGLTASTCDALSRSSASIKENYATNPDASHRRLRPEEVLAAIEETGKFSLIDDPNCYKNKYQRLQLKCKKCGETQVKNMMMINAGSVCFSCSPKESKGQIEVFNFVKSIAPDALLSDRTLISPKEVDVLVPSARLAIEYNGLYWHSTTIISDKNYHERKRRSVCESGHRFFMLYEDEWRDKRSIVEGMIRHRLGSPHEVLDARKLSIEVLDGDTSRIFFDSSHLEGYVPCVTTHGLVDGRGRVVAAMSLRRPFHASRASTSLEVARSACLPGVSIRGWTGRLTASIVRHSASLGIRSLMSYVDSRVGDGRSYLSSGWKLEKAPSAPRFWWTDYHDRFNRFKYKANPKTGESQSEVSARAGVVEIWGCGNYVVTHTT